MTEDKNSDVGRKIPQPRPYFLINNIQLSMIQFIDRELKDFDISPVAARVLNTVWRQPGISPSELARIFGISPQGIKETTASLQRSGYLVREPSLADRRRLMLTCTERGAEVLIMHRAAIARMYDEVFAGINDTELSILIMIMEKLLRFNRPEAFDYYRGTKG